MKRFYADATTAREGDRFAVLLDGRPVRTPARRALAVPTAPLAAAIAGEWREQGETVDPRGMRVTGLATLALDLTPEQRAGAVEQAAAYAGTDLLCYRAAGPAGLAERQAAAWQPWLDWAEQQYDARLRVAAGVMPTAQDEAALRALRAAVERLDDWRLVGLHAATTLAGSLVLGLAMERGALGADAAFAAATLDELYEIERWGEDPEQAARHARLRADLRGAEAYLGLLAAG